MGAVAYAAAVLADSPAGYFPCQEASGFPQDVSGNAKHMDTTDGTVVYQIPGPMGDFGIEYGPGGARHRRVAGLVSSATANTSMEFWFNDVITGSGPIIAWDNLRVNLQLDSNRKFVPLANAIGLYATTLAVTVSTWYHVVLVNTSGNWRVWRNAVIDTGVGGTQVPSGYGTQSYFGAASAGTFRLAHVAYYASALSSVRIAAHFNAASSVQFVPQIIMA